LTRAAKAARAAAAALDAPPARSRGGR